MILACARMHTHHIGGYYPEEPRTVAFFIYLIFHYT